MSFPAPSAFPDGKIVSDSLPADLWTFLQTSCDFPAKILRISCGGLLQGQADGKGDPVVRAGSPDRPAVEGKDFLGLAMAKPRPAPPVRVARELSSRKNWSKMRSSFSAGMVRPSLVNVRTTVSASCCPVIRTVDPGKL